MRSYELPTGRPSSTEYIEIQSSWVRKPCTIVGHEFFGRSVIMGRSIVPEVGDLTNSPGPFTLTASKIHYYGTEYPPDGRIASKWRPVMPLESGSRPSQLFRDCQVVKERQNASCYEALETGKTWKKMQGGQGLRDEWNVSTLCQRTFSLIMG